jgi:murein L,D-transpeptidase YafK
LNFFFILIIFTQLVFANDLIDFYRQNGFKNLQKEAERLLQSKEYWQKRIENIDTEFGYYEDVEQLIVVNKKSKKMTLYEMSDGEFQIIFMENIIIGKNRGEKFREGDRKTPSGVYKIEEKIDKIDPFYGPLAFTLSYPNLFDKVRGRGGSGIWIHGMPSNGKRESFTRGCVALQNNELKDFADFFTNLEKSYMILDKKRLRMVSKNNLSIILSSLYQWLSSWRSNDFENYISFYSKNFTRFNGKKFKWFYKYKNRVFKKMEKKIIRINNINILPYPNSEERYIFRVDFHEFYKSETFYFDGKKELYVEILGDKMQILVER